jgi:hypothetical protein
VLGPSSPRLSPPRREPAASPHGLDQFGGPVHSAGDVQRASLRTGGSRAAPDSRRSRRASCGTLRSPLVPHLKYLRRDGVTRDGEPARMFGADGEDIDHRAFAERCEDDRHHFRFIVSPEDAAELSDLKAFTRDLMADAERDLGTRLDWVAVDHWNTEHPHIHVILRGRTEPGKTW